MRWYSYILLFLVTALFSFVQVRIFPGIDLVEPEIIACFIILRFEPPNKTLWAVFAFTLIFDFLVLGSLISGVFTLSILPFMLIGHLLKEHILPAFSDLFLFGYFFVCFLTNYFLIRWLYSLFNVSIEWAPPIFIGFRALAHSAVFGAILILLGRFNKG